MRLTPTPTPTPLPAPHHEDTIVLSPKDIVLYLGVSGYDKKKVDMNGSFGKLTYKSSDRSIAKVSSKGVVTAKKMGTVQITGTVKLSPYIKFVWRVVVKKPSLKVSPEKVSVKKGKTKTLTVKTKPSGKATFLSKNKKIATVSSKGKITGKKKGKTTIVVTYAGKTVKVPVKVK